MGAIQDRTRDHLGQSDKAISAYRGILRVAIDEGGKQGADDARSRLRREDDRTGGDRQHRPDRRLAGLLVEDRCSAPQGVELGERGELSAC
jgi:hypothetical protein